ncbi:DNA primase [Streptomyces sp. NPDC046197]|uniref:DNA primase n=1 Tax=Streptomyces sp. NPDC046197 TaxID=3154337 RepID=UPI0033F151D9
MNRMGLGLAVGAGYLLGRTKKAKLALAVGSMVAGKKLNLGPRAIADLVNQQLKDNPQFKEIGDQLRQDLRGVGKAASGAMAERQMNALADRLHSRTAQVRDQLSGVVPDAEGDEPEDDHRDYEDEYDDREGREAGDEPADEDESAQAEEEAETARESAHDRKGSAQDRKGSAQDRKDRGAGADAAKRGPAKKAPAKKAAKKAPVKKAAAKKTAARKSAAKKTAAAGNATRGAGSRLPKGGGDR